jgi:hypothetical protein
VPPPSAPPGALQPPRGTRAPPATRLIPHSLRRNCPGGRRFVWARDCPPTLAAIHRVVGVRPSRTGEPGVRVHPAIAGCGHPALTGRSLTTASGTQCGVRVAYPAIPSIPGSSHRDLWRGRVPGQLLLPGQLLVPHALPGQHRFAQGLQRHLRVMGWGWGGGGGGPGRGGGGGGGSLGFHSIPIYKPCPRVPYLPTKRKAS